MKHSKLFLFAAFILVSAAYCGRADDGSHSHAVGTEGYSQAPLGFSLSGGWLDPWPHRHFSRRNTPFIHNFSLEPAFLDRDFFLDARFARGEDEDELEIEAELEWALTRRIGMVFEVPYISLDADAGGSQSGIGDMAIAPRFLLAETERVILSANLEIGLPSGDSSRDLGSGELGLAPSASAWVDLGNWFSVGAQLGTEHGLESGSAEFFYNVGLGYSFLTRGSKDSIELRHFPSGMSNLIIELTGRTPLDGPERGSHSLEALFGASYNINGRWEMRGGYQVPVGGPQEFDDAVVLSLIHHF